MSRLLASEFRRFRSRRLVKALVALELLAIVATGVIVVLTQEYDLVGLPDVLMGASLVLVSVAWVLGASAIGADWHAGHVTTILTWEPRRGRVMLAKIAASLTSVFVVSLVIQALLGAALAAAAAGAGSTAGADATWLAESAGVAVRVAVLSTIFAGFGFGLASAGRNTAGRARGGLRLPRDHREPGARPPAAVDALAAHRQRGPLHRGLADRLPTAGALDGRSRPVPGGGGSRPAARGLRPLPHPRRELSTRLAPLTSEHLFG